MKKLITNYSFNASNRTITFNDYGAISLDSILLVTNVSSNVIIYNFAEQGGTVSTNVLTLNYDTTGMGNGDSLMIYYDDTTLEPATIEKQDTIISTISDSKNPRFSTNEIVEVGEVAYFCKEGNEANSWYILRIDQTGVFAHATQLNNAGTINYSTARDNYQGLTYGNYSDAF